MHKDQNWASYRVSIVNCGARTSLGLVILVYRGSVHQSLFTCTVEPGTSLASVDVSRQNKNYAQNFGSILPDISQVTQTNLVRAKCMRCPGQWQRELLKRQHNTCITIYFSIFTNLVVFIDSQYNPLCNCFLWEAIWKDHSTLYIPHLFILNLNTL